jgi:hypothetical protein
MHQLAKPQFLRGFGFPPEWEAWGLYPDDLFERQRDATADDADAQPDEPLRYGASCWWTRRHRDLPEEKLIQLCRLAALDPDAPMAAAAVHDILFPPNATPSVAETMAKLAQSHEAWSAWFAEADKFKLFNEMLGGGKLRVSSIPRCLNQRPFHCSNSSKSSEA